MSNIARDTYEDAVSRLKSKARVALHFHPDRLVADGTSVARALLEQGVYRSQFETFISNGGVSAYPGGARELWEKRMFGGAYDDASPGERPKYGALDLGLHPDGPAPRFGSCYFLLSPRISSRCTFTYLDSHQDPSEKGTYAEFNDIAAALLKDAFFREDAIGERGLTPRKFIDHLMQHLDRPLPDRIARGPGRNLNHYIEAQVHGDVDLNKDVELLVADPSFKGTETGRLLEQMARRYAIGLDWHMGFAMRAEEVPADFRGPAMPSLAERIARNGLVDAGAIGFSAADLKRNPAAWSDRGTYDEVLQELKYMWHVLVRFGDPLARR
ncbi:DUF3626 domain-containing protein [Paenibacillus sp. P26]|nr:DUF3626 domain-containing protein [Paenibacillus sp. P26]